MICFLLSVWFVTCFICLRSWEDHITHQFLLVKANLEASVRSNQINTVQTSQPESIECYQISKYIYSHTKITDHSHQTQQIML